MPAAAQFYDSIRQFKPTSAELIDFFLYFLTVEAKGSTATAAELAQCFKKSDMRAPTWLASHLSKGLKSKPPRYVYCGTGYRLERQHRDAVHKKLGTEQLVVKTTSPLRQLEAKIAGGPKRDFLRETIDCFEVKAYRAATVMCWNLAAHHLEDHVYANALAAFGLVLAKNQDRSVKAKVINGRDDFADVPEGKFLDLCREAKIITGSLYNKLRTRLDERNAAAHPSAITKVTQSMASAYIDDLVENVLLKFAV